GGSQTDREHAAQSLMIVRDQLGVGLLFGPVREKYVHGLLWPFLMPIGSSANPHSGINIDTGDESLRSVLAVAAGFRRELLALDERRDARFRIGEAGRPALIVFSLAYASVMGCKSTDMWIKRMRALASIYTLEASEADMPVDAEVLIRPPARLD